MSEELSVQIGNSARASRSRLQNAVKTVTKKNTYAYKNIDADHEIRVLKIYKGKKDDPLEGRLQTRTLISRNHTENLVDYTALSYYWGEDTAKHPVSMFETDQIHDRVVSLPELHAAMHSGRTSGPGAWFKPAVMFVQDNLNAALRQIRSEHEDMIVWSDALCINQGDKKERAAQVAQMHEVYMQAKEVCIWLGGDADEKAAEETDKTFDFLDKILSLRALDDFAESLEKNDEESRENCSRVVNLMRSDYFGRRWVIQELALATNARVCRGHRSIPWLNFSDAISFFMTKHEKIRKALKPEQEYSLEDTKDAFNYLDAHSLGANVLVDATSNLFRRSNDGKIIQRLVSLEQLVSSILLAFEASDPRDTVFAVLQIAKDTAIESSDFKLEVLRKTNDPQQANDLQTANRTNGSNDFQKSKDLEKANITKQDRSDKRQPYTHLLHLLTWDYWAIYFSIVVLWNYSTLVHSSAPSKPRPVPSIRSILKFTLTLIIQGLLALLLWLSKNFVNDKKTKQTVLPPKSLESAEILEISDPIQEEPAKALQTIDERLEPNYNKSLRDVCAGFIEYCIETSESLDILCRHWAPIQDIRRDRDKPVPSWILSLEGHAFGLPKENYYSRLNGDSLVGSGAGRGYSASGKKKPEFKFGKAKARPPDPPKPVKATPGEYAEKSSPSKELPSIFDGTLSVKGIQLGVINDTATWTGGMIRTNHLQILGWSKDMKPSDPKVDQLWRTLVANRGPDGGPVKNWYRRACFECLELHKNQAYFSSNRVKDLKKTPEIMVEFLDRIRQVVWERTCFSTAEIDGKSFVGLGPNKAHENDLICILFGCSVPVVLREKKAQGQTTKEYKFIGECYVDGMMDGEAIEELSKFEHEWFTMR